jgi:hypothetical protein
MVSIGIVGSGVSALHLGLELLHHDIPVAIYTERSGDELAGGRLVNTVAHHHPTLQRERELGVHHWDVNEYGYVGHDCSIGGPAPLVFRGDFTHPSNAIDYRLYLPRLLADFEERGGTVEIRPIGPADLEPISDRHDLLVVAAGAGRIADRFPRRADRCPYDRPPRRLCAALYHGVNPSTPRRVTINVSPGHGELIELPIYSFEGHVTALLFEAIPGGDLEVLVDLPYADDPARFEATVVRLLQEHFPLTGQRIDAGWLQVARPADVLQGALTPTTRRDWIQLANGKLAVALGDTHTLVDPVTGQGANSASYSAWILAGAILEDVGFDELFCERVARRRAEFVEAVSDWTNLMLAPPPPHLIALFVAMAVDRAVADEFTDNFAFPHRQWANLATPERTRRYLARHGFDLDALLGELSSRPPAGVGTGGR